MFFFFRKKDNQRQHKQNIEHDKRIQDFVDGVIRLQDKASSFLQLKSESLSLRCKRLGVIAFCLITCSCCAYLIFNSFSRQPTTKYIPITPIQTPEQVTGSQDELSRPLIVSEDELKKIKKFRIYVDSLANSNSGKRVYDSILNNRPGLLDSLAIIENLFQSQSNK